MYFCSPESTQTPWCAPLPFTWQEIKVLFRWVTSGGECDNQLKMLQDWSWFPTTMVPIFSLESVCSSLNCKGEVFAVLWLPGTLTDKGSGMTSLQDLTSLLNSQSLRLALAIRWQEGRMKQRKQWLWATPVVRKYPRVLVDMGRQEEPSAVFRQNAEHNVNVKLYVCVCADLYLQCVLRKKTDRSVASVVFMETT